MWPRVILSVSTGSGCHNKYHQLGGLNKEVYFLGVLEAESPRWMSGKVQLLVRTRFLACRQLPSPHVLTCSSLGTCAWKEKDLSLLVRPLILSDKNSLFKTWFNLNYLLKNLIANYSHLARLEFLHINSGESIIQSTDSPPAPLVCPCHIPRAPKVQKS